MGTGRSLQACYDVTCQQQGGADTPTQVLSGYKHLLQRGLLAAWMDAMVSH
jgi:hypothetical protein